MATVLTKSRRTGRRTFNPRQAAPAAISQGEVSRSEIRAWARAHGYKVGNRGRVAADVVDAYSSREPRPK